MREVSCRVLDVWFRTLDRKRLSPALLGEGTGYSIDHLRDKNERIEWAAFVRVHENLCRTFSDEQLVEIGKEFLDSPFVRAFSVPARMLFTARDMYQRLVLGKSMGDELFSGCITPQLQSEGPGRLHLKVSFRPGLPGVPGFFLTTLGVYRTLPTLLGLPPARVTMEAGETEADYHIEYPVNTTALAWAKRTVMWPFTARAAAKELYDAHYTLQQRYHELEDYKQNLERKVRDRTAELAEARDRLAETVNHLRLEQQTRNRIFANLNHEIRTPLSLVLLAVGDLDGRLGKSLDERARQGLASIERSVRRLLRLIDGLLVLAAGQEDRLRLRVSRVDVAAILRGLIETWLPAATSRGLTLTSQLPTECMARVDEDALDRVITNLISNALKFTPTGGTVNLTLTADDDELEIVVSDSGIGIDDAFMSRIFGRFEQNRAPVNSAVTGSGLGLSLVKELSEAHGGSVSVANAPTGGAVFRVRLPLGGPIVTDIALPAPANQVDGAPPVRTGSAKLSPDDFGQGGMVSIGPEVLESHRPGAQTVLVAEDQPELREAIGNLLQTDYRVVLAADGIQALTLAAKYQPHVLVTDIGMPGMDGIELTKRFRELAGNRLAPVVLLTARTTLPDRLEGFEAGAVDYVMKPFEPDELRARIRSQLEIRALAFKLHESEKLAGLGVLSAGLAHELRNPANAIINAVAPLRALLPEGTLIEGTPTAQLFSVLSDCAQQIAMLSRQLLGLRRSNDLVCTDEPLRAVIVRALALVHPLFGAERVILRDGPHWDGTLICAGGLVTQVLSNLLENAAQSAGIGGWVQLHSRLDGERVVIEVTDSGPGVPRELRERIFEPFFTTKPQGQGTGLGLTTSRDIIDRHGGSMETYGVPGNWVFAIQLPLKPASYIPADQRRLRSGT